MNRLTLLAMAVAAGASSLFAASGSLLWSISFLGGVGAIALSRVWWLDHELR